MPKAERKRKVIRRSKVQETDKPGSATPSIPFDAEKVKPNVATAAGGSQSSAGPIDASVSESNLSRGQRKRQAKREKYLRKERMILSSLRVERAAEQSKRIDGLDAMKEALLDAVSPSSEQIVPEGNLDEQEGAQQPSMLKSNRGRKHLVKTEVAQMNLVLQHPSFQANPLDTIKEHLQNTIKPQPQPVKEPVEKVKRKRKKNSYRATRTKSR